MNRITLSFQTRSQEESYAHFFLPSQLRVHKIDTVISVVLFGIYAVQGAFVGDAEQLTINIGFLGMKVFQHGYITKRRQNAVGVSLSISNIIIGLLDVLVFMQDKYQPIQCYFQAMVVTMYHFCLLITSDFLLNLFTLTIIVCCKLVILNLRGFIFESLGVIVCAFLFSWMLYERTLEQKLHFVSLIKEVKSGCRSIVIIDELLQDNLNDGIIVIDYIPENLGFKYHRSNRVINMWFQLDCQETMLQLIRELKVGSMTIESYLFEIIQTNCSEVSQRMDVRYNDHRFRASINYYALTEMRFVIILQPVQKEFDVSQVKQENQQLKKQVCQMLVQFCQIINDTITRTASMTQRRNAATYQRLANASFQDIKFKNNILNLHFQHSKQLPHSQLKRFSLFQLLHRIKESLKCSQIAIISSSRFNVLSFRSDKILVTHLIYNQLFNMFKYRKGTSYYVATHKIAENIMSLEFGVNSMKMNRLAKHRFEKVSELLLQRLGPYKSMNIRSNKVTLYLYIDLGKVQATLEQKN